MDATLFALHDTQARYGFKLSVTNHVYPEVQCLARVLTGR